MVARALAVCTINQFGVACYVYIYIDFIPIGAVVQQSHRLQKQPLPGIGPTPGYLVDFGNNMNLLCGAG